MSAASFAFANNFISRTSRSGGDKGVMFSVLVTMGISAVLWLLLEAGRTQAELSVDGLLMFAFAGLAAMVFGRTLVFESIRRLGVTRSTAVKRLNPFFSALLAALLLAEPITRFDGWGMVAIALAFALLIRESVRQKGKLAVEAPPPVAYLFGVFGALAYASAYIARKAGLEVMPSPAFGTFFSASVGFTVFAALAVVSPRHRSNFRGMFRHLDKWIVAAAVMVSFGQIFLFAALAYERVTTVVMIASLEIFISILLSVFLFRSERLPSPAVALAAILAMAGVGLVAVN
ncbi:MAG: EamA family transporter [Rhodobacteraceae bacterium]|nr:EamA family transporter [Paracoccaceae bacterium]